VNEQVTEPAPPPVLAPPEQRTGMMLVHLLGLVSSIIGALVFYIVTKNDTDKPFVLEQAKEVLNFQITLILAYFACGVLMVVLIGFLLFPVVIIAAFIFMIVGTIKASNGESYRYPFVLRLVK